MPKKIDELTEEDDISGLYLCSICQQLYELRETTSCDFKTYICKCIFCTAVEREKAQKNEEDEQKKRKIEKLNQFKKYLIDNPVKPPQ